MPALIENNASGQLLTGIGTGDTTFTLKAGEGAAFPSPGAGEWFPVTLIKPSGDLEVVHCTARSGDTFTVTRSQEGTDPLAFDANTRVQLRYTKAVHESVMQRDLATLAAIAAEKAVTAVDVFVYDTSRDSDGGAWRNRCQHTSWYNEPLNTATRGSRKEFPAVAVIVAESNKITIYDGDDPSLPMWIVFNRGLELHFFSSTSTHSISAKQGIITVGSIGSSGYLKSFDFIQDKSGLLGLGGVYKYKKPEIINRNVSTAGSGFYISGSAPLVSNTINDVAMTVLPNAPVDPTTGLQTPTIAVATDGNGTYLISVIANNGTVYDIGTDGGFTCTSVSIGSDYSLTVVRSDGAVFVWNDIGAINADGVVPDQTITDALGAVNIAEVA